MERPFLIAAVIMTANSTWYKIWI